MDHCRFLLFGRAAHTSRPENGKVLEDYTRYRRYLLPIIKVLRNKKPKDGAQDLKKPRWNRGYHTIISLASSSVPDWATLRKIQIIWTPDVSSLVMVAHIVRTAEMEQKAPEVCTFCVLQSASAIEMWQWRSNVIVSCIQPRIWRSQARKDALKVVWEQCREGQRTWHFVVLRYPLTDKS